MADQFPELTAARARNQIVQNAIADERRPDLGESDPLRAARPTVYFAEGRPRDLRNDLAAAELSNLDRARFDAGGEETRIEYAVSRETPPMP